MNNYKSTEKQIAKETSQQTVDSINGFKISTTEFLANVSHDIRTPMNAILGMTTIAKSHLDDRKRIEDCLDKIDTAGRHLLTLINEVLDINKMEAGKLQPVMGKFNLSQLIEDLHTVCRHQIEARNHQYEVDIKNVEHEDLIGDKQHLLQIFTNLITNGVKYTPEGGKVQLTITEKPGDTKDTSIYEFEFQDNGIGMSEEFLPNIFEPFARADDVRVEQTQGTGLGMAIVKNMVQMMGGDIKVESKLNQGTKFTVTVPLQLQQNKKIVLDELKGYPVLVVDRYKSMCEYVCDILKKLGMEPQWATSGQEALELINKQHKCGKDFYGIIIDWDPPKMDAISIAKEVRKCVGGKVAILMMSFHDWADVETQAREDGVDVFLSMPLFQSRVVKAFKTLLDTKDMPQESEPIDEFVRKDFLGKRVLLVEDNDINAEIAGEILGVMGFDVEYAKNGKEAVDMISACEDGYYNIVFMDVRMPVMDGHEAVRAIRALPRNYARQVPIIAMSADAFPEDIQASKEAGMNEHIVKPIDCDELVDTLEKWTN